jgi:hypothetical protein
LFVVVFFLLLFFFLHGPERPIHFKNRSAARQKNESCAFVGAKTAKIARIHQFFQRNFAILGGKNGRNSVEIGPNHAQFFVRNGRENMEKGARKPRNRKTGRNFGVRRPVFFINNY